MNCLKCGGTGLYRDDDRQNGIPVIVCVTCGFRIYKGIRRRMGEEEDEGRRQDIEARKNKLQGVEAEKEGRKRKCEKCGKAFVAYTRAKCCLSCRIIVKREYDLEYNSKYHKRNLSNRRQHD
jgi:hypothetical protein